MKLNLTTLSEMLAGLPKPFNCTDKSKRNQACHFASEAEIKNHFTYVHFWKLEDLVFKVLDCSMLGAKVDYCYYGKCWSEII